MAQAQHRRETRWARRSQLRKVTSLRRVRNCGVPLDPEGGVTLAVTSNADGTRTAGYSGLASCGSVWCCPQCAAKIATRRADERSKVMRAVDEAGGSAFLLTLTMRHDRGDRLGLTKDEWARLQRLEENRAGYGRIRESVYTRTWKQAREFGLCPAQAASPLAARPYDLRHAALSSWLNAGVPPTEVAERAGHSVKVLLSVYAACLDGERDAYNARIQDLLDEEA